MFTCFVPSKKAALCRGGFFPKKQEVSPESLSIK